MSYYMFIANHIQTFAGGKIPSREVFNLMMKNKCWDLSPQAPFRKKIKKGDKIAFYLGGVGERQFVGTAETAGEPYPKSSSDAPVFDPSSEITFFTYRLPLSEIHIWKKGKPLKPFLEKLSFINLDKVDLKYVGLYLKAGIRKLTSDDYELIVS